MKTHGDFKKIRTAMCVLIMRRLSGLTIAVYLFKADTSAVPMHVFYQREGAIRRTVAGR